MDEIPAGLKSLSSIERAHVSRASARTRSWCGIGSGGSASSWTRDGVILLVALVPVLGVDVLLEARSRAALKKVSETVSPRANVVRDGTLTTVPTSEVVALRDRSEHVG